MRLIDADRLKRQVEGRSWRAKGKMVELIDNSPTIRVGENSMEKLYEEIYGEGEKPWWMT